MDHCHEFRPIAVDAGVIEVSISLPEIFSGLRRCLEACMTAAYAYGLPIEKIEIDGTRPRSIIPDETILEKARTTLMPIKSIKLVNGLCHLPVMPSVQLLSLWQLEMANCWLVSRHLMKLLEVHGGVIRHAHFDGISLHSDRADDGGACSKCPRIL